MKQTLSKNSGKKKSPVKKHSPVNINKDINDIRNKYEKEGVPQLELIQKYGITKTQIQKFLFNGRKNLMNCRHTKRDEEICRRYKDEIIPQAELARQYGVSRERIRQILYIHNVKSKPASLMQKKAVK